MSDFEPRPFGKYFLTERIAVGGMAEIYKAKTFGVDGFEKVLAIKKILTHYSADKEFITMLTDEAKLVVNLSHANIVQVYDLGRVGDDYFISMEYINGINLRELIEHAIQIKEKIPEDIALYIISEVCKGLDYAHSKRDENGDPINIVHRDISPQNILVSHDGGVKIVDFGIAKAAMNSSQTNIGILKGKVTYMAPEQAFGKPIDGRTDLFSCGIILYELFSQKRLFTGDSQMEILKKIRNTKIDEKFFGDEIPDPIKPILAKALAYSVKNRYQSVADLQIDLTRILYSYYSDFSPRKLIGLLDNWFQKPNKSKNKKKNKKSKNESILVSSSLSVSGSGKSNASMDDTMDESVKPQDDVHSTGFLDADVDTIRPDQKISKEQLRHSDESDKVHEPTEKSELTQPKGFGQVSVEELLKQKKKSSNSKKGLLFFVLFLALVAVLWKWAPWEQKNKTIDIKKTVTTVEDKVSINIKSNPEGSQIYLNGSDTGLATPALIKDITLNEFYDLKLVKKGYKDFVTKIRANDSTPEALLYQLEKLPPTFYTLTINSKPVGAKIYIDGKESGSTPKKISSLEPGKPYLIKLSLNKYKKYEQTYVNHEAKDQSLSLSLDALPTAKIYITSKPYGAKIFLNGKATAYITPHELSGISFPQTVSIKVQKTGYLPQGKSFKISTGKKQNLHFVLKQAITDKASISISSNLVGANVFVNDKTMGITPLNLDLKPGSYRIYVSKSMYQTESKTLILKKGSKKKKLYFKLVKAVKGSMQTRINNTQYDKNKTSVKQSQLNTSRKARLRIDSVPSGASVKINGVGRGITPIVLSNLSKNISLRVEVTKKGYNTWSRSMTLERDKTEIKAVLK
jgi:serine/threonine protein kinase